ncbi:DNA-binding NarL/FixJ family response regulator [Wenyingzhuangia heitensis]|uniref:DNA-binding NarL/FixJ family response regulator n=1 Tax=Wenyingzhuangia heitensis TaxID=1487859 RepID=A0ABX0U8M1_9FLAO|nr:hypothetical protein [Wenyingzhuangia heitensis]NIJ43956.1 DNA-binding NarL/FixJ family response regulator [Wenyingzhuangia heitensis]
MLDKNYNHTIAYVSTIKNVLLEQELLRCNTSVLKLSSLADRTHDWEVLPDVIIFDDVHLDNWKDEWECVKQSSLLKAIPCLLLTNFTKEEQGLINFLKDGLYGYVFNSKITLLVPLCTSAIVQGQKIKNEQLKVNELNRVLSTNYLVIDAKNTLLDDIKKKIDKFIDSEKQMLLSDVKELSRKIDQKIKKEYHYQLFKIHFEEVHPLFYKKLLKIDHTLTDYNLKFLAFLKMGFNNNEISFLLNISIAAVKKTIQRIKPKLKLKGKDSIREFVFGL